MATSSGNEEISQLIAYHFPSLISKKNGAGDTALHIAARSGMLYTIQILVCCGKDFPGTGIASDLSSFTSENDFAESTGDDGPLRTKNVHGNTALHEAVLNRHHDVAQFLISADPQVWNYQNKDGWSPLYMAVKIGDLLIFRLLLQSPTRNTDSLNSLEGSPPAHATIIEGKIDMLEEMAKVNPELLQLKDGKGRNVLHWAAHRGNLNAVGFLSRKFRWSMFEMDDKGFFPIHIASKKGHVNVITELLKHWPYPTELLSREGQNILHVAAKSGKNNVVKYILETPALEKLLNARDINGNTPLHLAAMHSHPAVVISLTWEKKKNINLLNNENLTAYDATPTVSGQGPRMQYVLTNCALWSAGAKQSLDLKIHKQKGKGSNYQKAPATQWLKEWVGMLLMVETLVATVTFTAAFTVPGGYNGSENPDKGMATMLNGHMFRLFVVCSNMAFYSSIISIFSMFWTVTSDYHLVATAYKLSLRLFLLALGMMSIAFMAAVHVAVSRLSWLAYYILIMGIISLVILLTMFVAYVFPLHLRPYVMRYISYYISLAIVHLLGPYTRLPLYKVEKSEDANKNKHKEPELLRKD
ncbi:hypothetical protein GH714_010668 [Hevea brasiliensis]|uniref:PGG domain-containing protein n=1 Tax=Hevea brasiliensis TaxID=3981 RepID=A0A6A6NCB5_HEVBR|nr:hypothetical protein GH714_010668 [Hevea brasiliensis]